MCKQLSQIIQEEDDEERGYITAKDFMNDFATEEFLNKNIRVRPVSGLSRGGGDDGKTNDPYARSTTNEVDGDEKDNQMKIYEMEVERQNIKKDFEDYTRKKKLEEEKAKKKR